MTDSNLESEIQSVIANYCWSHDNRAVAEIVLKSNPEDYPHLHAMTKDSGNLRNVVGDIISGFEDIMRRVNNGEEVKP
jgi:hypothetical protein